MYDAVGRFQRQGCVQGRREGTETEGDKRAKKDGCLVAAEENRNSCV